MTVAAKGFNGAQMSLFLFSSIGLSIKYLDITKFGILELGENSDQSMVIGAFMVIVAFFIINNILVVLQEFISTFIEDGRVDDAVVPDFSQPGGRLPEYLIILHFFADYTLIFIFRIFPVIFGLFGLMLARADIAHFLGNAWGIVARGG